MKNLEEKYLERLSELYPTIAAASTEVINLEAILNLPKGTEHFPGRQDVKSSISLPTRRAAWTAAMP